MSNNLLTDCFDQDVVDFIREVACNCGCGACAEPRKVASFTMTDTTPDFDPSTVSIPYGCTNWGLYEPNYHNHYWGGGQVGSNGRADSTSFHTTMKGYEFYIEMWAWCEPGSGV